MADPILETMSFMQKGTMYFTTSKVCHHTRAKLRKRKADGIQADSQNDAEDTFTARVEPSFRVPTIALEEIQETIVRRVACYDSLIHLSSPSYEKLHKLHDWLASFDQLLVISPHQGCKLDRERTPHLYDPALFLSVLA